MKNKQTWRDKVQKVYSSLSELEAYDEIYNIAARCGYESAVELWKANPRIGGSVNAGDFGLA